MFILNEEIKEEAEGDCGMKIISHHENEMKPLGWGPFFVNYILNILQSQNILNNIRLT